MEGLTSYVTIRSQISNKKAIDTCKLLHTVLLSVLTELYKYVKYLQRLSSICLISTLLQVTHFANVFFPLLSCFCSSLTTVLQRRRKGL